VRRLRRLSDEIGGAYFWLALAVVGWLVRSVPLALVGTLGALSALALYFWARVSLVGVSYRRRIDRTRAMCDERITLEIEIVNDKLLPISWLQIEDEVPSLLEIEGGTVVSHPGFVGTLVHLVPLLPYQRIRSRLTLIATHRGEFTFGPAKLSSGDPVGLRERSALTEGLEHLLVYPKVFALSPAGIVSRALLGDLRSRRELLYDPSRTAGVREYRVGDPLRFVDWRATARSTSLLVREFEPSVTPRIAVFLDFSDPTIGLASVDSPELEFAISVAASLLADLASRKVAVGLFSSGSIAGGPVAVPVSTSPAALPAMLESLARARPSGGARFAQVLNDVGQTLQRGTSVVVVALRFSTASLAAIAELRRRNSVTAIWVGTEHVTPPAIELFDALLQARYTGDWQQRQVLELTR
jgi:uncharacterized protein (DUF58 family)